MGLFDKIGDVIGDVVDGVVDFVDDVIGIELHKVLDNDFVKYGLMAASIFTGGVAIANGVMTGFTKATAAKGFMNKFVEGAAGFVQGAAQGFMNPGETAGNLVDSAKSALTGTPTTGAGQVSDALNASSSATDVLEAGSSANPVPGAETTDFSLKNLKAGGLSPEEQALSERALQGTIPDPGQMNVNAPDFDAAAAATRGPAGPPAVNVPTAPGAAEAASGGGDFLSKMGGAVKDFITSEKGIETGLGALQGWAEGEQLKAIYEERRKLRERNAASWGGGGSRTPRTFNIPSLQELRDRRAQVDARGNQAQARYGY